MLNNNSGKILTVFMVIFAILLISLSAISIFFFQKELERRKEVEAKLEQVEMARTKVETELKDANKKMFVLEEKNKEADEKINSLLEDLELEQGLREEMRLENQDLKKVAESAEQERQQLRAELTKQIEELKSKNNQTQEELSAERQRVEELQAELMAKLAEERGETEEMIAEPEEDEEVVAVEEEGVEGLIRSDVELNKIIISSGKDKMGSILTIDSDNNFLIFDLGDRDGVSEGDVMAVYRKDKRLGEIKVTRVQPAMSAADFLPPLSGKKVRKSDQVLTSK